jgi:hypothetical protein
MNSSMYIFSFWWCWLLRTTSWRWQVSQHQANMLLSTLKIPSKEEEDVAGGGAAVLEHVVRGVAEEEGTSMVMTGAAGN